MPTSQAQAALRRKLLAAARMAKPTFARNGLPLPRIWFMTDPKRTPYPERIAAHLPKGFGIVFRHFGGRDRFEQGKKLSRACRGRCVLLVSADPALAQAIGADGVHWPEARLRGVRSRKYRWIETASAHSAGSVFRAHRLGMDAAFLSPVFESASPSAAKSIGPLAFRALARSAPLPVYALGGVNAGTGARAMSHAAGFAAIEAIVESWKS